MFCALNPSCLIWAAAALELMRSIGVNYRAAWRMKQKLMQVMLEREQSTMLHGTVQMDDAYLGGEKAGGKAGRGSENKVPFVAAVQINEAGNPVYAIITPVKIFSHDEIEAWVKLSLVPGTTVVSDGLFCFQAVTAAKCVYERVVVGKGRKSTDLACFKWVNTTLGNMKNSITGTYHAVKFNKYAHRYFAEFQYLFNRRFNLATILPRLLYASVRTGPH